MDDKICFHWHQEHCNLIFNCNYRNNRTYLHNDTVYSIYPSSTQHQPLTKPSLSHQPPLNKTAITSHFGIILFIVNLTVVYWFFDEYMNKIDCSPHNIFTIMLKLTKLRLELALVITKQLQYLCFQRCIAIECWILWNYSYWCTFKAIGYNCVNFSMRKDIMNYKKDQICIISYAHINASILNESLIIEKNINHNKINTNGHAVIEFYHNESKMSDFYLTAAIINVVDTMKHTIEILVVICTIISKVYVFIMIYDTTQKASNTNVIVVFIITNHDEFHGTVLKDIYTLVFKSNAHSKTADSFSFCSITNNMVDINVIIFLTHAVIIIIDPIDGIYIILTCNWTGIINVIWTHTLGTKISNGCILNTDQIITIIIIHYNELDTNICK